MFNVNAILSRASRVLGQTDSDPFLVGYDANEIQAFVTASSRPVVMRGASAAILEFDRQQEKESIFAGGGQGIIICMGERAAGDKQEALERAFHAQTAGEVLVTDSVPFDPEKPMESVKWLRQKLSLKKDAAAKVRTNLPSDRREQCASCGARKGTRPHRRQQEDGRVRIEQICERCERLMKVGGRVEEMAQSLNELSPTGRIAAVSADGNDFGALFDTLRSPAELAIVSAGVRWVFAEAQKSAEEQVISGKPEITRRFPPIVGVAVGGDDVRAFVAEEDALTYVLSLVQALKANAALVVRELSGIPEVSRETRDRLEHLGVGIGMVSADSHFPAYRLLEYAHDLERSAKRVCSATRRFALDFAVLRSGDEMIQGTPKRRAGSGDIRPIHLSGDGKPAAWAQAQALARVPATQVAMIAEEARREGVGDKEGDLLTETASLLRYQVARSDAWKDYYETCGADWRKPADVEKHRPRQGLLDLMRLLGGNHDRV